MPQHGALLFCAGVLAVIVILWAVVMNSVVHFDRKVNMQEEPLPHGVRRTVLAMELSRHGDDLRQVLCSGNYIQNIIAIRRHIKWDFPFMFLYWVFFLTLSSVFTLVSAGLVTWIAVLPSVTATLTLVFDVQEDLAMLRVIRTPPESMDRALALSLRRPALAKWAFLNLTVLFLGVVLLPTLARYPQLTIQAMVCVLFLISGIIGLFGMFEHRALEWASLPLALGMVLIAVMFLVR